MAIERTPIDLTKKASAVSEDAIKEFKARAAKVVTRGFVVDRLSVELPPDVHGEWIRHDPVAVAEARALGFEVDTEYAAKSALHSDATGKPIVGDVIFMTIPKWKKDIIEELKQQEYARHHGVRGGKTVEETQFESNLKGTSPDLHVINESKTVNTELRSAVEN